ncbi:MAG: hypothetical protein ACE5E3_00250 [Mariprofundus sp.]
MVFITDDLNLISEFAEAQKSGKLTDEQALEITSRYLKIKQIKQDRFKVKNAYIKNSGSSRQKGRAFLSGRSSA